MQSQLSNRKNGIGNSYDFRDEAVDKEMEKYPVENSLDKKVRDYVSDKPIIAISLVAGAASLIGAGIYGAKAARKRYSSQSFWDFLPASAARNSIQSLSDSGRQSSEELGSKVSRASQATEKHIQMLGEALRSASEVGVRRTRQTVEERPLAAGLLAAGALLALGSIVKSSAQSGSSSKPSKTQRDLRPYEERSYKELYERAKELQIDGRSNMSKGELIEALRH